MEKEMTKFRNLTLSLKLASDEKIMLKGMAEKYNVSLSELIYNLVLCRPDRKKHLIYEMLFCFTSI